MSKKNSIRTFETFWNWMIMKIKQIKTCRMTLKQCCVVKNLTLPEEVWPLSSAPGICKPLECPAWYERLCQSGGSVTCQIVQQCNLWWRVWITHYQFNNFRRGWRQVNIMSRHLHRCDLAPIKTWDTKALVSFSG